MASNDQTKSVLGRINVDIAPKTQQMLNEPLKNSEKIEEKDIDFMKMLVGKIEKGDIELFKPGTLINKAVYENLDEKAQGKADYDAFNLLATIREIYRLWKEGHRDTYQIVNLVHSIRLTKERLEQIGGDIYII